jgi:rhodanese-related sulfurtransferase
MNRTRFAALAAAAALSLATLTSCGSSTPRVEPKALAFYSTQGPFTAVDIRNRPAFDRGHLPQAVLMENWVVPPELDETPKGQPVVVCGKGEEGKDEEMAAEALVKAGFKKVSILKGGMAAYAALKLPTQSKEDEERAQEMIESFQEQEEDREAMERHSKKLAEKLRDDLAKRARERNF